MNIKFGATGGFIATSSVLATLLLTGSIKSHWGGAETGLGQSSPPPLATSPSEEGSELVVTDRKRDQIVALVGSLMGEDVVIQSMEPFLYDTTLVSVKKGELIDRVVVMPGQEHIVAGTWYSLTGAIESTIPPQNAPQTDAGSINAEGPTISPPSREDASPTLEDAYRTSLALIPPPKEKRHWALNYSKDLLELSTASDVWGVVQNIPAVVQGEGPNDIYVFFDPLCPVCQQQHQILASSAGQKVLRDFTFHWIPVVRFIGKESEAASFGIGALLSDSSINDGPSVSQALLGRVLSPTSDISDLVETYTLTKSGRENIINNTRLFFRIIEGLPESTPGRGTPLSVFSVPGGNPVLLGGLISIDELQSIKG